MKLMYLISDPKRGSNNPDRTVVRDAIGYYTHYAVIKAGVCGDAIRAWKKYSKDYDKIIQIFPVDNAKEAAGIINDNVSTILSNRKPTVGKYYKTPIGNYRRLSNAAKDLDICQQVLGRWCNHNHKEISTKLRMAHPELFGEHYTFQDAGFGRTG